MADTTDLKKGVAIKRDNKIWFVIDTFFVSPGKGSAFYRTKLKEVNTGKVVEVTFKSGEGIELVETERRSMEYLYKDGNDYVFMDQESYEQHQFDEEFLGEDVTKFLKENTKMILFSAEETPLSVSFPKQKLTFKVTEAPPGIKGDTVSNTTKEIVLETGARIQAPLFINENDFVIVNVETGEYCERTKGE